MILHPAQKEIIQDSARFKVVTCGRGFGKTALAIESLIFNAVMEKGKRVAYIAPTIQQTRDIALKRLVERTRSLNPKVNKTLLDIEIPTQDGGTSAIVLRGWEAIETLRGQEFDYLVIDEVSSVRNFWEGWEEVLRPTLRISRGEVLFISTPKGFNHFYDLFNTTHENWKSFKYTSYDNPFLPIAEIEEAKEQLPENSFAQEYLADFRKHEGLVYKDFIREKILFDGEVQNVSETIIGVDFGYTNPAAVITIKKDYDNTYWVTNEYYETQRTDDEVSDYVKNCHVTFVYPDPENAGAIRKLKDRGVNVRDVVKGPGSVVSGINTVRELLKSGKLRVHKECKNLIMEFEMYHYPDAARSDNENPVKEDDHALDALRYAISMNKPVPKKKYRPQEEEKPLYSSIGL